MILVDTSVWIDHLRRGNARLGEALDRMLVLTHPFVIAELACGNLRDRRVVLGLLDELPVASVASEREVRDFIERRALMGRGIGYIDVHLLASTMMTQETELWTRDKRLTAMATELGIASALGG